MRRTRWPENIGGLCRLLGLALGAGCLVLGSAASVSAQQAPRVEVLQYAPRAGELAGQRYIFVRGLLINHGPGPASRIQVALQAFGDDPETPIGVSGSISWLDSLDSGASGPFSIAIKHCCPEDVTEYRFLVTAEAASERPYPALAFENVNRISDADAPQITGELRNLGQMTLNAPSLDVYMGFWQADALVALETARMPVLWGLAGPTGQSHPPGMAYPWQVLEPDVAYDRYELWANGRPYPDGLYPVPLGFDDARARREDEDIYVTGMLRHCGMEPSDLALLLLTGRDARDRVRDFTLLELLSDAPILPGERGRLEAFWPMADPAVDQEHVSLIPLALETQARRPEALPCLPMDLKLHLPALDLGRGG